MGFFTVSELIRSNKAESLGIDNTPDKESYNNLLYTISQLEAVRAVLGCPMIVSSGYRCEALNKAVKGSKASLHTKGLAVDFSSPSFGSTTEIVNAIIKSNLMYDSLILEYPNKSGSWVHIQFSKTAPRRLNLITTDGSYKEYNI